MAIDDGGKPRTKILPGKLWDGEPAKGMCDINGRGKWIKELSKIT